MKKVLLAAGVSLLLQSYAFGQGVGINDDNSSPAASAMLDVKSTNKGMLVPRMTTAQRIAIVAPATGLLVFDNTSTGFWYFDGTAWIQLVAGVDSDNQTLGLSGNTLSITGGNSVNLTGFANTDNQTLGLTGTTLNITGGNNVNLSSLVNDADAVIGNEYNTAFTLSGNNLTITDGGGGRTVSLAALTKSGRNGLRDVGNFIHLGGDLVENTTVTAQTFGMNFNLNSTGDFHIQDGGINHFSVFDNGNTVFGGDVQWRDENTVGTLLGQLIDDGNDGRFLLYENGATSVDLDANTQFIFNEQGLDRNFRIESDLNQNMMFLDAGTNRLSVGTNLAGGTFNVQGNSYHSDDIYLRDGGVSAGDVLVRIFDSSDDGIIDVYENNAMNHRIHGNGVSVFNEQGNNNADIRMESDANANMFFLDAGTNRLSVGTNLSGGTFNVQGNSFHSDDIYLRDGAVNTGDVLVRIFDSADDGIIDVYENNVMNHRIHGNGVSVFNEQGNNNADIRMESDTDVFNFLSDASTNRVGIGTGAPAQKLHVVGTTRISTLAGAGNRMVVANANGDLLTQAVPANGDITGVTAGTGLTGGGTVGNVTLNAVGINGLTTGANDIRLGGNLIQNTTVTAQTFGMNFNLNSSGDFHIQDNGINHFSVFDNGNTVFGGDVQWRDENTVGTLLGQLIDDGNDGRFLLYENGATSVDLDANTQFIFNEQGLDRNFRIESDVNPNMLFLDAGLNRLSVGTNTNAGTFNVLGTSYHSDDIYLRDGAVNGGDVLVRLFDSGDDGIIDVYENNAMNHRIHGNGVSVFNEQGNNNADMRMESDLNANMFFLDAGTNRLSVGTNLAGGTFNVQGNSFHSDDIYLRDGAVNGGDVLVRIYDSSDDGIIDVYENNAMNHRIHGNGVSVFNEQGNNNADIRIESDLDANNLFSDAGTNRVGIGTGAPAQKLHVVGTTRISTLAGTGNRMVVASANGDLLTQAVPANGDITGVTAGNGLVGGANAGNATVNAVATNGLRTTANDMRLGGNLIENTVINQGTFNLDVNLNSTGDFNIQDNGVDVFAVIDNGSSRFGGDVQWRDVNTVGTVIADLFDDGNDGRFRVMENGGVSVDLDANTQFIFNEQGLDRNFRVESDADANMFLVDAGTNRIGMGTNVPRSILDIRQAAGEPEINMTGATNTDPTLVLTEGGNAPFAGGAIRYDGDLDGLVFLSDLAFPLVDERMFISRNDGDIGMGTTAPNARLSVNGVANKTGGGTWAVFSDRRLKKDITDYNEGLSLINKIRTVNFTYNDKMDEIWGASPDTKGKVYQGVIAQELQEIAPDMVREVTTNEDAKDDASENLPQETYLEVDPNKFTYALINAVQEQQAIIEQLKKEQADTKKELAEIKALLLEMNKNK